MYSYGSKFHKVYVKEVVQCTLKMEIE